MSISHRGIDRRQLMLATGAAGIAVAIGKSTSAQEASSGSVRVGVSEDGYRTDERANIGFFPLNTNIFESLVYLTPDYQIEPLLAESWEFVEPSTWRLKLREGVSFHDGTPFNAEAVKYTMDRIASNGGGVMGIGEESAVIVDDSTIEITPTYVNMRMMEQIGHPNNSILPPGLNPAESRNGTGPFREVEYVAADHYTVEANPEYWGESGAGVGEITFQFYADPTARLLALQAGDVDLIVDVPRQSASEVEAAGATLVSGPVGAYEAMYMNIHGVEPYDLGQDIAVREAVSIAIDRQQVIDSAWQGNAEPGTTMIPPAILGDSASLVSAPEFDPERAREVLEAAGWVEGEGGVREKDGRALNLTIINGYGTAADHGSVPELIQAQLGDIGIDLEIIQTPDTATYEQRLGLGEGDLWLEAGSQNDGNPAFLPELLFRSPEEGGEPEATAYGRAFATGEEFDTTITRSREATDIAEVQEAAAEAMNIVINEERVVTPLCGFYRIIGHTDAVASFDLHASGVNQRWTSLTLAE
ncbi:MAG: ABC transporter substrate-binding protein [Chloroflexia bacterium]|nr:ABC transporter substrate-binding protein [Chloroflexia bacterium]